MNIIHLTLARVSCILRGVPRPLDIASPAEDRSLLNVTQIAAMAGVTVSAVSNWRKRFDDFPRPAEGVPGGRDLFDLGEVEHWLQAHGRLTQEEQDRRLLFQAANLLRGRLEETSMIEALGAALALVAVARRRPETEAGSWRLQPLMARVTYGEPGLKELFDPLLSVPLALGNKVVQLIGQIEEGSIAECFEWLLSSHDRQGRSGVHDISETQATLLSTLIEEAEVVYDPAAGWGALLRALWRAAPASRKPELIGQDVNASALRLARQRLLIEDIPVTLAAGDSLRDDGWPGLLADAIVCNPPFAVKSNWSPEAAKDPRWRHGLARPINDFAWLQHCAHHLRPDGRAFVFLPAGSLFRNGPEARIRARLVEAGMVEAIFSLPPGSALSTSLPLVLWGLRRPGERERVLLVDLATPPAGGTATDLPMDRVASIWERWRTESSVAADDLDVAASVAIESLLQAETNLVPARWINHDPAPGLRDRLVRDFENLEQTARAARRGLENGFELPPPAAFSCTGWITVKQLAEEDRVEFVKGVPVNKNEMAAEGIPLLRTLDLTRVAGGRLEPTARVADGETGRSRSLTRSGDVVLSPASGSLRAAVDHHGGNLLARPLQGLRLLDPTLDPEVVATFLEAPRNRRFVTGSAYARVSLRDLELPILDPPAAEALRRALVQLREQERQAADLALASRELRRQVANLTTPVKGEGVVWTRSR